MCWSPFLRYGERLFVTTPDGFSEDNKSFGASSMYVVTSSRKHKNIAMMATCFFYHIK